MKKGLIKLSAVAGAVAMSLTGMIGVAAADPQQSGISPRIVAGSGEGRYRQSIDWMEWADQPDQQITSPKVVWSTPHDAGNNQWIATQCTVTPQSGGALETYRSGEFYGDALTTMYNVGTNNIVGVANQEDAATVTFGYSCKEYVVPSTGAPTLSGDAPAGSTEVPLEGLVFADAESNNWTYYQQESIQATPTDATAGTTWRLLDSYRTPGCTTSSLASMDASTKQMIFRSNGGQCANDGGGNKGPASVMFLQKSQSATVDVKGGGRTAVALGVMPAFDFGDAPESYGVASAQFGANWTGGELGTDITASSDPADGGMYNLSTARENGVNPGTNVVNSSGLLAKMDQPEPRLGATEDAETGNQTDDWAVGDDNTGAQRPAPGDEDGITMSPDANGYSVVKVQPNMTAHTYSQQVNCAGPGDVKGWIDWNRDGNFDQPGDASATASCPAGSGNVTLNWTNVPNDAKRSVAGDVEGSPTFMRVRIGASGSTLNPTGFTGSGEVEDYQAAVMIPQISVVANLPSKTHTGGRIDPSDQFDVSLKDGTGATIASDTTTGANSGNQLDHALGDQQATPGADYTVGAYVAAGSASANTDYDSQVDCRDISKPDTPEVTVNQTTGEMTMPTGDSNVQCMITRLPGDENPNAKLTVTTVVTNDYAQPAGANTFERNVTDSSNTTVHYGNGVLDVVEPGNYSVAGGDKDGYTQTGITCTDNGTAMTVADPMNLVAGHNYACTIAYKGDPGVATWTKNDSSTHDLLSGSSWLVTNPDQSTTEVDDCTAAGCTGPDVDPTPGAFKLENLKWGTYKIKEKTPPSILYLPQGTTQTFDIMAGSNATSTTAALGEIPNTRATGTLTVKTHVKNGSAHSSDFLPTLKTAPTTSDPNGTPVAAYGTAGLDTAFTVNSGDYVFGAGQMPTGYKQSTDPDDAISCTADNGTIPEWKLNPPNASDKPNQLALFAGHDLVCTVNYEIITPTLKVTTVVHNTHGGTKHATDFNRTVKGPGANDTATYTNGQQSDVDPGTYTVTGSTDPGYSDPDVTYALADGSPATVNQASVAIAAGQDVVATITYNDKPAKVTVTTVVPAGSGLNATTIGRTVTGPTSSDTATYTNGETKSDLNAGSYKADGDDETGYTKKVTYKLDGHDVPASDVTANGVAVGVGQHLEATITYEAIKPKLTVKTVVNNTHGGTATTSDFTTTVTGPNGTVPHHEGQSVEVDLGTYKVTGSTKDGYSDPVVTYALVDASGHQTPLPAGQAGAALGAGQNVVATVTYNDEPAQVTVNTVVHSGNLNPTTPVHTVTNPDGTQTPYTNGQTDANLSAGNYSVKGADEPGYIKTITYKRNGQDVTPDATTGKIALTNGQHLEATVTYEQAGKLTVNTVVNGPDGNPDPAAHPDTVGRTVTYPDGSTHDFANGTGQDVLPGSYKVKGDDLAGYSAPTYKYTKADGSELNPDEAGVAIAAGEDVTATITYNPQARLTVKTVVNNTHGGTATANDFSRTVTNPDGSKTNYADGQSAGIDAGAYKVTGSPLAGYSDPTYKYTLANGDALTAAQAGVAIAAGQDVTATITYNDKPAQVTVTTVVNGGDLDPAKPSRTVTGPGAHDTATYTNGETKGDLSAGGYKADGADEDGYTKNVTYTLDGRPVTPNADGTVPVGVGQHLEATITYTKKPQANIAGFSVHLDRDYRFGGSAATDGSKITKDGGLVALDQTTSFTPGTYDVSSLLRSFNQDLGVGYEQSAVFTLNGVPVSGTFTVKPGDSVELTFKNVDKPATLKWSRFDADGRTPLPGSTWRLNGPDGQVLNVDDCTALACTGLDQDPTPGVFEVPNLRWGSWTITETQAPAGHRLSKPLTVTMDPQAGLYMDGLTKIGAFQDGKCEDVTPGLHHPAEPGKPSQPGLSLTGSSVAAIAVVAAVLALCAAVVLTIRRRKE